ncbi:hypothetical protein DICSQDRAFT_157192 [Dichomitus squalens LYAD-421 SS1]|uniref:Uncharacterized protein n=1 Tax=Dichomitus squalens (strain LYAD-421) TaxID=732165 RepID=R7SS42_DICSQ|nr:uncharacterized protein DICSQDRAFT_157192 [Dichomitus squalens LYAD-421 SS1]EJF57782.1 hypothetical protein DICSQDRAFT_157192 [Dichomitus squalens LYAD-421 SS1]
MQRDIKTFSDWYRSAIHCGSFTNSHRFRCHWPHCIMMPKVAGFPSPRAPQKPSSSHVMGATMPLCLATPLMTWENAPSANGIRATVMSHVMDLGQTLPRRNNYRGTSSY